MVIVWVAPSPVSLYKHNLKLESSGILLVTVVFKVKSALFAPVALIVL